MKLFLVLLLLVVGIVIGNVATWIAQRPRVIGTLRIDHSNPAEPPYMFLEVKKGIGDISKEKYIIAEVSTKPYISQE